MTWRDHAPCLGATEVFFQDVYGPEGDTFDEDGYVTAFAICASCPVRRPCAVDVLQVEEGLSPDERFGITAGMTPEQRFSLSERGTLRHSCGHVRDPINLIGGALKCPACGIDRRVPQIPLTGDRWRKRHTTLARKVVAWMTNHVALGEKMPQPTSLASDMKVRVQDMVRVYEALCAAGTLDAGKRKKPVYVRARRVGAVREWKPIHLRCTD